MEPGVDRGGHRRAVEVEAEERRDAFGGAGEEITPQRLHEGLDSGVFFSMDANGKRVKQSRSRR